MQLILSETRRQLCPKPAMNNQTKDWSRLEKTKRTENKIWPCPWVGPAYYFYVARCTRWAEGSTKCSFNFKQWSSAISCYTVSELIFQIMDFDDRRREENLKFEKDVALKMNKAPIPDWWTSSFRLIPLHLRFQRCWNNMTLKFSLRNLEQGDSCRWDLRRPNN